MKILNRQKQVQPAPSRRLAPPGDRSRRPRRPDATPPDGPNWLAGIGVGLLLVSLVVLVSGAVAEVWLDDAPVWVKLGFGGGAASVAVLVTWAVWSRLRRGKDPYEEVVR